MDRTTIFEFSELPPDFQDELKEYYKGTDHREILNDSYTRYPYLNNLDDSKGIFMDKWFLAQSSNTNYVIIHWEW